MLTEARHVTVAGIRVEIDRKDIKNLHLGVYPPNGRVRVATPLIVSNEAVRLAVIDKLGWIKRQKAKFAEQPRQSQREMVNGESHYFLGRRYRLRIHEHMGPAKVAIRGITSIDLFVRPGTSSEQRYAILQRWYREQLRMQVQPLLTNWEAQLGVQTTALGIKTMKTKWGSCNVEARRVWLNLELVKKPLHCLEYIIVHELVHLLERRHNENFTTLLNQFLPSWRAYRDELNASPLGYQSWDY